MKYVVLTAMQSGAVVSMLVDADVFKDEGSNAADYFKPLATDHEARGTVQIVGDTDSLDDVYTSNY